MNGLEIYIHIPFCVKKCDYCDFLSAPADLETKEKYVEALINEIKLNKNMLWTLFLLVEAHLHFQKKIRFQKLCQF